MVNTLRLIAQARSVNEAKKQFADGVKLKNTDVRMKGTVRTFNKYLKLLKDMEINPITVPKNWEVDILQNLSELIVKVLK